MASSLPNVEAARHPLGVGQGCIGRQALQTASSGRQSRVGEPHKGDAEYATIPAGAQRY